MEPKEIEERISELTGMIDRLSEELAPLKTEREQLQNALAEVHGKYKTGDMLLRTYKRGYGSAGKLTTEKWKVVKIIARDSISDPRVIIQHIKKDGTEGRKAPLYAHDRKQYEFIPPASDVPA